jgi:hypothetical protein
VLWITSDHCDECEAEEHEDQKDFATLKEISIRADIRM